MQAESSDDAIIHRWLAGWDTYAIARAASMKEIYGGDVNGNG